MSRTMEGAQGDEWGIRDYITHIFSAAGLVEAFLAALHVPHRTPLQVALGVPDPTPRDSTATLYFSWVASLGGRSQDSSWVSMQAKVLLLRQNISGQCSSVPGCCACARVAEQQECVCTGAACLHAGCTTDV